MHLFSHTGGKLDWDEAAQTFLPGKPNEDCRCVGAGAGRFGLAAALVDGAAAGAAAATDAGFAASGPAFGALGEGPTAGAACRDLPTDRDRSSPRPSSTSRTTSPPRTSASRSARASGRSSTSSATPRPAWRPTRARRRTSTAWRSRPTPSAAGAGRRPDDLPASLHADHLRRLRRLHPRQPLRGDAPDADRRLGRGAGRRVRAGVAVAPRPLLPAGGRGHARGGRPRVPAGPRQRRHVRRLDARQDRGRRPGRRRVHEPACTRTPGPSSGRDAAATACCSARTASSATTASSGASRPTAST